MSTEPGRAELAYEIAVRRWQIAFLLRVHQVREDIARGRIPGWPNVSSDALQARLTDALAAADVEGVGPRGELGPEARAKVVKLCDQFGMEHPP
jgi:hypothetical protein